MGAVPTYVNQGAFTAGTGAISVSVPTGYADGDILVLLVSSANEVISTPSGWAEVTNSPQGTGTAGAAGGIRLAAFWKLVSGSQSSVSVADSGSVTAGQMFLLRGIDTAGPINITAGSVNTPASTSWSCPAITTTIPNCLILICIGQDRDANSTTSLTAASNANLASLTKRADETVNTGAGGGLGLYTGSKVVAGDTGVTSVTSTATTTAAFITIALVPPTVFGDSVTEPSGTLADASVAGVPFFSDEEETVVPSEEQNTDPRVEMVGTPVLISTTLTNSSTTITVPSEAEFALIFISGCEETTTDDDFGAGYNYIVIDGVYASFLGRVVETDAYSGDVAARYIKYPSTGSKTISWILSSYITYGYHISVIFFRNVDHADPFIDWGSAANGGTSETVSVTGLTTAIGALTVGAASTRSDGSMDTNGQTQVISSNVAPKGGLYYQRVAHTASLAGVCSIATAVYTGLLAVVLRAGEPGPIFYAAQAEEAGADQAQAGTILQTLSGDVTEGALVADQVSEGKLPLFLASPFTWGSVGGESSGTPAITVPVGATVALIAIKSAVSSSAWSVGEATFSIGSANSEYIGQINPWDLNNRPAGVHYIANPPSGSQTLIWAVNGTDVFLHEIMVLFYGDTGPSPIRDFKASAGDNYGTFSLTGLDAEALCLTVALARIAVTGYDFSSTRIDFDLDGQTERAIVYANETLMAADKPANPTSVSVYSDWYTALAAVVLQGSVTGGMVIGGTQGETVSAVVSADSEAPDAGLIETVATAEEWTGGIVAASNDRTIDESLTCAESETATNDTSVEHEEQSAPSENIWPYEFPAAVVGSVFTLNTALVSGSTSITVPTGATFALVFWALEYSGGWNFFVPGATPPGTSYFESGNYTIAIGEKAFDHVVRTQVNCSTAYVYQPDVHLYTKSVLVCAKMNLPPEGAQVFSWGVDTALDETGHLFSVVFLQGIDGSEPFLDIAIDFSEYDYLVDAFMDVSPSDPYGLVIGAFCQPASVADVTNGGAQTALVSHLGPDQGSMYLDIGYKQPVDTETTRITLADSRIYVDISLSLNRGTEPSRINAEMLEYLEYSDWKWGQAANPNALITEPLSITADPTGIVTSEPYTGNVWEITESVYDELASAVSVDRDVAYTLPVDQVNGPYVDIPTEIMFSDSRSYQVHDYTNTASGGRAITIHADTDLLIFAYHTLFSTPAWIQDGNFTLTLNGIPFTHLISTNVAGYNVMVAYFKNPESGDIVWSFPNPNFGGVEQYADIIKICQFINVDVSGDPFRSVVSHEVATNATALTLSGISTVEGDMVVGIEYGSGGGGYGEIRCNVGRQPNLTTGGAYNSIYGWSIRTTVGVVPWHTSSIAALTFDGAEQDYIYMMALVLKVKDEGWIALGSESGEEAVATEDQASISEHPEAAERAESLVAEETPGGTSSHTETDSRSDNLEVTELGVGSQEYGSIIDDTMLVENVQASERTAYGMGYAWAIVRTRQNASKSAEDSLIETLALSEDILAWRGLYVSLADTSTVEEITSVYNTASRVIAESIGIDDESTTIMVSWGFAIDTSFVTNVLTNTAIMNAARIELFTLLDGYSALRVECYFPEMIVTYGETSYIATLYVPTIEAIFNSETIMGTLQDNEIEAIFSQNEITAVHDTPEIEAIAAGAVVATLSLSTYIATKGE